MTQTICQTVYTGPKTGNIVEDLVKENNFLLKLVDTIPPNVYFDHDVKERITSAKHQAMDERAKGLKRGFSNNSELSAKSKHKRARLDPFCQKSVSQIQQELGNAKQKKSNKVKGMLLPSASLTRAANIEELQKRLQERINEFQSKRKGTNPNNSKKKNKGLKKKEKKMKDKKVTSIKVNEVEMQANKSKKKEVKIPPAPEYNKEGKIIYSKLDFTEEGLPEAKKSEFSGKTTKMLLKKAEHKKEKIETLKSTDPEKAVTLEKKEKWKKAILQSENVKVKDDPKLLKKTIKKEEKIKKKKAKVWKEREEQVEGKMKSKQDRRTRNIKKRKDEKLKQKIKHAKKRGRILPGF